MTAVVMFGIAAAVFVFATSFVADGMRQAPAHDRGTHFFLLMLALVLVAASAGLMYAVASGMMPVE